MLQHKADKVLYIYIYIYIHILQNDSEFSSLKHIKTWKIKHNDTQTDSHLYTCSNGIMIYWSEHFEWSALYLIAEYRGRHWRVLIDWLIDLQSGSRLYGPDAPGP